MTRVAPQNPPKDGKMARQPKLTTKSGMPRGITTRTAQIRRPGMSVRSTNQAATVPTTAQRNVTTTVRLTVSQSNCAVRLRKSSGSSVAHPTWAACTTKKTIGRMTATEATSAASMSRCGGWRRRSRAPRGTVAP